MAGSGFMVHARRTMAAYFLAALVSMGTQQCASGCKCAGPTPDLCELVGDESKILLNVEITRCALFELKANRIFWDFWWQATVVVHSQVFTRVSWRATPTSRIDVRFKATASVFPAWCAISSGFTLLLVEAWPCSMLALSFHVCVLVDTVHTRVEGADSSSPDLITAVPSDTFRVVWNVLLHALLRFVPANSRPEPFAH